MSKSRPYSSVPVKGVDVESLAKAHAGQACVLGVDVAKLELVCVLRWPDGSFRRPWRVANPGELGVLTAKLKGLAAACPVTVAMESSGTYGDALRQALGDAGLQVRRVSSKAVKDQAETFDGVPSQHDGKDAAIIADLCARGKGSAWRADAGGGDREAGREMRYQVRKLDAAQRVKQVWVGKLEGLLARHDSTELVEVWPEATGLVSGCGATLCGALAKWGDPAALAADPEAGRELARLGGRYLTAGKVAALVESARTTGGVRMGEWERREVKEVAGRVLEGRSEVRACRRRLRALTRGHAVISAQEPALGLVTACVLWVSVGDPRDYGSAAAYRKAMGLNLPALSLSKRWSRAAGSPRASCA